MNSCRWLVLAIGLTLAACGTVFPNVLEKNAVSSELQNETTPNKPFPSGCPNVTKSIPEGKTNVTVCYQEPTTDQNGARLTDLGFTTIYLRLSNGQTKAIRVWTNDAHGGARVKISNISVTPGNLEVCVTATDWARNESPPGSPAPPDTCTP